MPELWRSRCELSDIGGNEFLWSSVWRFLCGIQSNDGQLPEIEWATEFGAKKYVNPRAYLKFADANSPRFDPTVNDSLTEVEYCQAVVQAWFSDRPGLKARAPGFGSSGVSPSHIGKTSFIPWGQSLGESLEMIPTSSHWTEFYLFQWRQIEVSGDGMAIAPYYRYSGPCTDPWTVDSGRMAHCRGDYSALINDIHGRFMAFTICLDKSSILSTYRELLEV